MRRTDDVKKINMEQMDWLQQLDVKKGNKDHSQVLEESDRENGGALLHKEGTRRKSHGFGPEDTEL